MSTTVDHLWLAVRRHLAFDQLIVARNLCELLLQCAPGHADAHLLLAGLLLNENRVREATAQLLLAAQAETLSVQAASKLAIALARVGETAAARECLARAQPGTSARGADCAAHAHALQVCGQHDTALTWIEQALARGFDNADVRYFQAIQWMFVGNLNAAARALDACLRMQPGFGRATLSRARLRRQTPATQHLDDIRHRFDAVERGSVDHAALEFAQFKELDDLGDHAAAWHALARGNAIMHQRLPYSIAQENALVDHLLDSSTAEFLHAETPPIPNSTSKAAPQPIFIVGMPRSGTTLLERLLGNHSQIVAAGELDDLTQQLRWQADYPGRGLLDCAMLDRMPALDYANLGVRYLAQTQWRAPGRAYFIDKTPANYLLAGIIYRALPHARILHIVREPMDVCFSNYKALFGDTCAYSYEVTSLATHYRQYARTMRHWHAMLPGRILDVAYADLIAAPEATMRHVLQHCGLSFEAGCCDLSRNTAPVATLSAPQMREGMHDRATGAWQCYADQLATLRMLLASSA